MIDPTDGYMVCSGAPVGDLDTLEKLLMIRAVPDGTALVVDHHPPCDHLAIGGQVHNDTSPPLNFLEACQAAQRKNDADAAMAYLYLYLGLPGVLAGSLPRGRAS